MDEIVADFSMSNYQWLVHHSDGRGHCTMLSDWGGNIMEQYEYDAFGYPYFYNGSGNARPNGSTYGNRFLFTGREWLPDLKLYDFRNRMYQPELGRFLQPDPKEFAAGDYNLYRYCHNDPVNKVDPFGLLEITLEEYKRVPFSNLKELVQTKYEAFTSWTDAGKAGGRAAGPQAVAEKREYHGRVGQVVDKPGLFIYGRALRGDVSKDHTMNESNMKSGPLPLGVRPVASYWVLGRHQDVHSWPVNRNTGISDGQVLRSNHISAVMTNPPSPGATSLNNQYTYKWYDADNNKEGD